MTISRKAAILLTAYITAGALALGGFLVQEKAVSRRLRIAEDNSESRAFASLSESLNDMDDALYKALCASSPPSFPPARSLPLSACSFRAVCPFATFSLAPSCLFFTLL